jgi:hypothetical protein
MTYPSRELQQLDEIEDVLQAYADARLSPTGPVLARIRANVLAHAAAPAALGAPEGSLVGPAERRRPWWSLGGISVPRRAVTMVGVATFAIASTTAVIAAPPGSPFYQARVAVEAALLPTDIDARLAAHEEHLAERLAAAELAAASGDVKALSAALVAFQAEVDAAVADVGLDAGRLAHLEAMLAKHVAVLTALEAEVPAQAAIDDALRSSQTAIEQIKDTKGANGNNGSNDGRPGDVPGGTDRNRSGH